MMRRISVCVLLVCTALVMGAALVNAKSNDTKPYLDIQKIKTEKGLTAWIVQDDTLPIIAVKFSFAGGAQWDAQGKEGTTELLSTLLDEGAGKRDSEAFQKDMDVHGVRISFSAGSDRFTGSMKAPTAHKDIAFDLLGDALNRPHFNAQAVTRMKHALGSQLRFLNQNPRHIATKTLFETAFARTDYARPTEGTLESLEAITINDVRTVHKALMCRERVIIAVAGQIDERELSRDLDRVFSVLPSCEGKVDTALLKMQEHGKTIRVAWQGAQDTVLLAQQGVARQDADWWAAQILNFALGGGQFSSRLMDQVRVQNSLTYGIYSMVLPYDRAPLWMVQANVDPSKLDKALELTRSIWRDVAENGLTQDEIADAKAYLIGSLPLALTSTDRVAAILLQLQEDGLPADTLDRRKAEIDAVTVDDIRRVARARLDADAMVTVIVGPQSDSSNQKD